MTTFDPSPPEVTLPASSGVWPVVEQPDAGARPVETAADPAGSSGWVGPPEWVADLVAASESPAQGQQAGVDEQVAGGVHPMLAAVREVRASVGRLAAHEPVFVPELQKREMLDHLVALEAQVAAVRLATMTAAGDVADRDGAKDVASWMAATQQADLRHARQDQNLAASLSRWSATQTVLSGGEINLDQARVIAAALDAVAEELSDAQRVEAEQIMLDAAQCVDPAGLRVLGRRLVDVVDPDSAEEREARRLAEEEKHAAEKARLSLRPQGDGTTRISGRIPDATAQKLSTFLEAFAQPRKQALAADGKRAPYPRLLARALGDLLDRIDPDALPDHGGDAATVIVTITLDQLRSELATAGIGFGDDHPITAAAARKLACQAQILPVVLGGHSQILDAGRKARLHSAIQRKMIRLQQKTCQAEGCTVKAEWCEVHHLTPWSQGGKTSVKDGVLLCCHHHHRVHDPDYLAQRLTNGKFRITRRT